MSKVIKIVAAAAAGFVAGVLLAPKSGKETRADIKQKAEEAKDYAAGKTEVAKQKAAAGLRAAKAGANDIGEEATDFLGRTGKRAGVVARDVRKTAENVADDAKATGQSVRDAMKK